VLVSCHAATLARDAAGFVDAGYRPTRLVAVDLFPQTPHLEAVLGWELP
jgi:23S rRNA (uracil1939-C5)-methyltransferase